MAKSPPSTSVKVGNLFSKPASVANIKRKHFKTQMADLDPISRNRIQIKKVHSQPAGWSVTLLLDWIFMGYRNGLTWLLCWPEIGYWAVAMKKQQKKLKIMVIEPWNLILPYNRKYNIY